MSFRIEDILKDNTSSKINASCDRSATVVSRISENNVQSKVKFKHLNTNPTAKCVNVSHHISNIARKVEVRKPTPLKLSNDNDVLGINSPACSIGDMTYNSPALSTLSSPGFCKNPLTSSSPYGSSKIFFPSYEYANYVDAYNSVLQPRRYWTNYPFHLKSNSMTYLQYARCNLSKRKGGQIRFTPLQTDALEKRFDANKYLNPDDRKNLADSLKLSDRQVKTWFQNRRAKWRRINHVTSTMNGKIPTTNGLGFDEDMDN